MVHYGANKLRSIKICDSHMFIGCYDCEHGGTAYSRPSIRAHWFIDPKDHSIKWRNLSSVYFANDSKDTQWIDYENLTLTRAKNAGITNKKVATKKGKVKTILQDLRACKRRKCIL